MRILIVSALLLTAGAALMPQASAACASVPSSTGDVQNCANDTYDYGEYLADWGIDRLDCAVGGC